MNQIDLNAPPPGHKISASVEPEETTGERGVRLFKEVTLFVLAIVFVGIVTALCYNTLTSPAATPDEKKWAMSFLTAAAGGIIGYLVKR